MISESLGDAGVRLCLNRNGDVPVPVEHQCAMDSKRHLEGLRQGRRPLSSRQKVSFNNLTVLFGVNICNAFNILKNK